MVGRLPISKKETKEDRTLSQQIRKGGHGRYNIIDVTRTMSKSFRKTETVTLRGSGEVGRGKRRRSKRRPKAVAGVTAVNNELTVAPKKDNQ